MGASSDRPFEGKAAYVPNVAPEALRAGGRVDCCNFPFPGARRDAVLRGIGEASGRGVTDLGDF